MKKSLHISGELQLPLDSVTQTFAILAKRRVGKTYTASVLAEEMARAGLPFVVLDPTGAWWGLRSSADGKSEGLPVVIIGGQHGDLPLEAASGKVIAELVVEHPGFYVLDLSDTDSDAAQDRFATAFAQRLYRLKDKHRDPLHLFIDEADSFAPQRPLEGQKVMLGAFEALVRRGGIRGIGMTLITQRPAVLNKNVLTQCEVIIALQTTSPQDQDAVDDWVKRNGTEEQRREMMGSLASLKQGEAWFYSPAWLGEFRLIHVRERETFNSSATPKVGEKRVEPKRLARVDLEQLKGKIADSVERAKANDPSELKRRVAELERELTQARSSPPREETKVERVEVYVLPEQIRQRLEVFAGSYGSHTREVTEAIARFGEEVERVGEFVRELKTALARVSDAPRDGVTAAPLKRDQRIAPPAPRIERAKPAAVAITGDFKLSPTQQRILDALAWFESLGNREPRTIQLGAVALIDTTGGYFSNMVGPLVTGGLVVRGNGTLKLTAAGRALARVPEDVSTLDDYHRMLRERVRRARTAKGKTVEILDFIITQRGAEVTTAQIGEAIGVDHTGGYFSNIIGPLSTLGLITRSGGVVRPTEILFPEGLR